MQTKRCTGCFEEKKFDDFGNEAKAKSGKKSQCRVCAAAKAKIYNKLHPGKSAAAVKAWASANPEKRRATRRAAAKSNLHKERARHKAWRLTNPEKYKERCKRDYAKHKEKRLAAYRAWYLENRESVLRDNKEWSSRNRGRRAASLAKRRAALLQRTPKWLTSQDFEKMNSIYELCRALQQTTGVKHHVDHEYPLQGNLVSGLHVPANLRILTAEENLRKKNNWSPEC